MFPLIDFRHNITVQQEPQASANNGGQPSSPSMTRLRAIARKSYPSMSAVKMLSFPLKDESLKDEK